MDEPEEAPGGLPPDPWVLVGVLTLVALVFLPTLRFGFVYDDGWTLLSNGFLREGRLVRLLGPEAAEWHVPDPFRPTLVLLDTLTYRLFGLSAPGTTRSALACTWGCASPCGACSIDSALTRR